MRWFWFLLLGISPAFGQAGPGPVPGVPITGGAFLGPVCSLQDIGATSTDGFILQNNTLAANGAQQWSPRLHFSGQGWKTTATAGSQAIDMIAELQPVQGTTAPTGNLIWSISTNSGSYLPIMRLSSTGAMALTGGITAQGNSGVGTTSPNSLLQIGAGTIVPTGVGNSTTVQDLYSPYSFLLAPAATASTAGFVIGDDSNQTDFGVQYIYATGEGRLINNHSGGYINIWAGGSPQVTIKDIGYVGIGTTTPGSVLEVNGTVKFDSTLQIPQTTPANSSATCTAGMIYADANYIYACAATNTWKRAALSAF